MFISGLLFFFKFYCVITLRSLVIHAEEVSYVVSVSLFVY
jgi:hypothetical protein